MNLVHLNAGRANGEKLYVLLLKHMTDGFIEVNPNVQTKTCRFYPDHTHAGSIEIKIVSRDDWIDFKNWCQSKGVRVTANLKKRTIDGNKVWWPSVVEIMPDDESNEYWIWMKLRDYY
jgi:hypothetical protein